MITALTEASAVTPKSSANSSGQVSTMQQKVAQAISNASSASGVEFSYLLNKADQESSLDPNAKAKGSSATGLFQFVDQTWLRVVKNYGDKYGLSDAASRISIGSDGVARVSDSSTKQQILAMRKDPTVSAEMAAELTNENKETLECEVGGKIGSTELYLAHFLGANGACSFIKTMRANPNAAAADILPQAAGANSSVFYDSNGNARSLKEIYQRFASKFSGSGAMTAVASSTSSPNATTALASLSASQTAQNGTHALDILSGSNSNFSGDSKGAAQSSAMTASAGSMISGFHFDKTTSSPFAAMVLAQMDLGSASAASLTDTAKSEGEEKRRQQAATQALLGA